MSLWLEDYKWGIFAVHDYEFISKAKDEEVFFLMQGLAESGCMLASFLIKYLYHALTALS